jgi:anthraniloyl-CoA monooxygenase
MRDLAAADPETVAAIGRASLPLTGIELRHPEGTAAFDGFPVSAISRHGLREILRERAEAAGAKIHYGQEAHLEQSDADVVVLADGVGSAHRGQLADTFGTSLETGAARYIWLGTEARLGERAVVGFERREFGVFAVHVYAYGDALSTVVVETDEASWRAAGLDIPGGEIDQRGLDLLSDLFAGHLRGHRLLSNRSRWSRFSTVRNTRWHHGRAVLLGDAAHTAHFSIGSGTKLAMQDAVALARALAAEPSDAPAAFARYEAERKEVVARTQRVADRSMRWWETFAVRLNLPPAQFAANFLTRTGAIGYDGLRRRCEPQLAEAERSLLAGTDAENQKPDSSFGAAAAPLRRGGLSRPDRLLRESDLPAWLTELPAPPEPADSPAGGELVRRAARLREGGAEAVLLRPDPAAPDWWENLLELSGRLRLEAGLLAAVPVPEQWRDGHWPERVHMALISGRADLIMPTPALSAAA